MHVFEYFKRLFEIIYLVATGIVTTDNTKRIEGGSVVPLRITAESEKS